MMSRYIRLIGQFARVSLQREMAFRANFWIHLIYMAANLAAGLAGISILFHQVETLHGWSYAQALALLGIYMLLEASQQLFIRPSLDLLGGVYGEIWKGTFDFNLLKPVHTQFLVSFRNWNPWALGDLLLDLAILGYAISKLGGQVGLLEAALFLLALAVSITLVYAILLLLTSGVFWYQAVPLAWLFDSSMQMGRYPVGIYPGWLRLILTWIVPVGFIVTMPAEALTGRVSVIQLLIGAAMATTLLVAASAFFRISLRRYSSASS